MSTNQSGTVLPFQDAALRRPIDVVALAQRGGAVLTDEDHGSMPDNVVSLARFARGAARARRRYWLGGPPEGEAA
jgi:hypothetical protein